jgi:hypothetical protein
MLLAVAALLLQFPLFPQHKIQAPEKISEGAAVAQAAGDSAASVKPENSASSGKDVLSAEKLPSDAGASVALTPGRRVAEPLKAASSAPATAAAPAAEAASPAAFEPAPALPVYGPVYGPPVRAVSDHRQEREWLALSITAHSAAGFDAWSTRRVISSVPGAQEMNPLLRPFAGNASMYAAVQVAPTIFDFVSRRMMHSRHAWARHTWWLPQAVSAAVSLSSGVHNVGVYNSR